MKQLGRMVVSKKPIVILLFEAALLASICMQIFIKAQSPPQAVTTPTLKAATTPANPAHVEHVEFTRYEPERHRHPFTSEFLDILVWQQKQARLASNTKAVAKKSNPAIPNSKPKPAPEPASKPAPRAVLLLYRGRLVALDGTIQALIEHTCTGASQYYLIGAQLHGLTITGIEPLTLRFSTPDGEKVLQKGITTRIEEAPHDP